VTKLLVQVVYILGEVKGAGIDIKTWQVTQLHVKLNDNAALKNLVLRRDSIVPLLACRLRWFKLLVTS
jgi:hypothetical protein